MKSSGQITCLLLGGLLLCLLLQTAAAASGGVCPSPAAGLVAWYPADGNADDVQAGNDGTLKNGAGFSDGMMGQAFSLDGVDDFVFAPSTPAIDPTNAGSQSAWVNFSQLPSSAGIMEIIGKGSPGRDFDLQAEPDNRFHFFIAAGSQVASTTTIRTGIWYHVAGTWDSTVGINLYVNGVLESTNSVLVARSPSAQPLEIGNQPFFGPRFFNGRIDEVQIFDRALSDLEVAEIVCTIFCGDANTDGRVTATDALIILRKAVGTSLSCPLPRCDTDGNRSIVSSDALRTLRFAVGQHVTLDCPAP